MILRNFIHVVIVYALVLGVMALPGFVSVSHLTVPAQTEEAARHQALSPIEIVDHDHSHDDGEEYEQLAGHNHGHDPADHSHQVVFISHAVLTAVRVGSNTPSASVHDLLKPETAFGIDRPPKLSTPV